ncbi:SDR family NAD(P)-dependent oxidoreductase [Sediminispirochaeta bajacaliforniensis]|uniref:SDR family NAD(P)-dependent oxidoreductase n=1 Tax=Sediminispirochaeta bajacaliforniensis TaxID=148 RepID=UPI000379AB50|nr:SDR family NAD(P)-dependent oxidoreductase [Sediminispirochaeta bajacaliforniensis]
MSEVTGMKRFNGQLALITGAATGIGAACALRFAEEGANIVCVDLKEEENRSTVEACEKFGVKAVSIMKDVTDKTGAAAVIKEVLAQFDSIDILVCSAGLYTGAPLADVSYEQWKRLLDINLTGTFLYNQAVAPVMMKQKSGSIINVSSMAGKTSWPASAEYSASKSGVIGLTRSVAMELAPYGATCNALCPGNTLTAMVKSVAGVVGGRDGMTAQEWLDMRARDCPMQRLAEPWEMAGVVSFLASRDSRYLTGQSLSVDGGMVL